MASATASREGTGSRAVTASRGDVGSRFANFGVINRALGTSAAAAGVRRPTDDRDELTLRNAVSACDVGRTPSGARAFNGIARSGVCPETPVTVGPTLTAFSGNARSVAAAADSTSSQPFSAGVSGSPANRSLIFGSETRSRPGEVTGAAGPALRGTSSISQPSADEAPPAALESACNNWPDGSRSPAISTGNTPAAHQNFSKLFVAMTNHPGPMARARLQHTLQPPPRHEVRQSRKLNRIHSLTHTTGFSTATETIRPNDSDALY